MIAPNPPPALVPDCTVHKGNSKHHKTDKEAPILWCTLLHKYLENKIKYPTTPRTH